MFARGIVLAAGCIALMFGCAGQPLRHPLILTG